MPGHGHAGPAQHDGGVELVAGERRGDAGRLVGVRTVEPPGLRPVAELIDIADDPPRRNAHPRRRRQESARVHPLGAHAAKSLEQRAEPGFHAGRLCAAQPGVRHIDHPGQRVCRFLSAALEEWHRDAKPLRLLACRVLLHAPVDRRRPAGRLLHAAVPGEQRRRKLRRLRALGWLRQSGQKSPDHCIDAFYPVLIPLRVAGNPDESVQAWATDTGETARHDCKPPLERDRPGRHPQDHSRSLASMGRMPVETSSLTAG